MKRIRSKKWRLTLAVFIWAVSILVVACSAGRQDVRPAVDNPQDLVNGFERSRCQRAHEPGRSAGALLVLKGRRLAGRRPERAREQAEISRIAEYVSIGQSQLKKAEEIAAVARTSMADVIKRREMARKAGAAELEGYPQAERSFFRLTKEIENNNLDYALRNKEKVKNSFRDLEIAAIKRNVLGEVRVTLNEADRLGAKKYAPKAYADAVRNLNVTDAFITENPYEVEEMTRQAQEALFYARRSVELTRQSKKIQAMNSEQIALWIEDILSQTAEQLKAPDMRDQTFEIQRQNITGSIAAMQKNQDFLNTKIQEEENEIETLKDRVFALEGKSRQEQIAREQLEAEKKFNEKFESIQNSFRQRGGRGLSTGQPAGDPAARHAVPDRQSRHYAGKLCVAQQGAAGDPHVSTIRRSLSKATPTAPVRPKSTSNCLRKEPQRSKNTWCRTTRCRAAMCWPSATVLRGR